MIQVHDPTAPLFTTPTLLEASAGTGKTHAIAELAVRYLIEPGPDGGPAVEPGSMLLLTFSNQAADELRSRVFRAMVDAHDGAEGSSRRRLAGALSHFDEMVISTIHGFCEQTLSRLGVLGDWDKSSTLLPDSASLVTQCATDVYLAKYHDLDRPPITLTHARTIAKAACASSLPLEPVGSPEADFADAVRQRTAAVKRARSLVSFDDLQARLRSLLESEAGDAVGRDLRRRHRVVLVDEFQDTDPDQWAIMKTTFIDHQWPIIMIGDPKQSIYGFRNADLMAYLDARTYAQMRTLDTNHRSDEPVVEGVGELFGELELGDPRIVVAPVASRHPRRFWMGGADRAGVWLRHGAPGAGQTPASMIEDDLGAHIELLLAEGTLSDDNGIRALTAGDIAILARTKRRGLELVAHLNARGIPAVWTGQQSLAASDAARQWRMVILAMVERSRGSLMQAAMSRLLGFDLGQLVADDSRAFSDAAQIIHRAIDLLASREPRAWTSHVLEASNTAARLASEAGGQQFVLELEEVAATIEALGATTAPQLLSRFDDLLESAGADDFTQRSGTEAPAVRVMTLHSAKGLQFPVVMLPEVSEVQKGPSGSFTYIDHTGQRRLWVKTRVPAEIQHLLTTQAREEELRLLYVGLTRAKHVAIMWHASSKDSPQGALTALMMRDRTSQELRSRYAGTDLPTDQFSPDLVDVQPIGSLPVPSSPCPAGDRQPLTAVAFTRAIDTVWRRTSYTALTAVDHDQPSFIDEPEDIDLTAAAASSGLGSVSPMNGLPAGAAFGSVMHELFERIDWSPTNLGEQARSLGSHYAPALGLAEDDVPVLQTAIQQVCTTPLGALAGGASLSDIPISNRLAELDFDLPMSSGGSGSTVADLAELLVDVLPPDDPLVAYPHRLLESPSASSALRGVLTGSIDVTLRTEQNSFLIIDYKTNRFPTPAGTDLHVGHYGGPAMAEAMMQAHYPLQALLYGAALHRYLAWRLASYDPDTHLGGIGYLFLRGMGGADTPVVGGMTCGVFEWHPPTELFVRASNVLGGGS